MDTVSALIEGMDRVYRIAPEILFIAAAQCALMLAALGCLIWGAVNHRRIKRAITELDTVHAEADAAVADMRAWYDRLSALQAQVRAEAARIGVKLSDDVPPVVH